MRCGTKNKVPECNIRDSEEEENETLQDRDMG